MLSFARRLETFDIQEFNDWSTGLGTASFKTFAKYCSRNLQATQCSVANPLTPQFEIRIHPTTRLRASKRMIDILNPEPKVIEALTNIDLPSGVSIDVKMM